MSKALILRVVLSVAFFYLVFFGVWFAAPILGLLILIKFRAYEVVLGALIMDLLYATSYGFFGIPFLWTLLSVLAFFAFTYLRSKIF